MLIFFTIVVMAMVAYAFLNEGLFTAMTMFLNMMLAGLIAFNYFEPIADYLEDTLFSGSVLAEYSDFVALVVLFAGVLGLLRFLTYKLAPSMIEFHGMVGSIGGAVVGLVTGYFLAGILVCLLQTLPLHETFLDFKYKHDLGMRRFIPPDRVWLAMMCRAGAYAFANDEDKDKPENIDALVTDSRTRDYKTFDKYGTYELRYARYRRWAEKRNAMPYGGELNRFLHK